jgi:hypothetical protein
MNRMPFFAKVPVGYESTEKADPKPGRKVYLRPAVLTPAVLLSFLLLTSTTCSKSGNSSNNSKSCSLQTGTAVITYAVNVLYSASKVGGANITTITYEGPAGNVYVSNPTLPWTISVSLIKGNSVAMSAVGTAPSGGGLTISYAIQYPNNTVSDSVSCSH